MESGGTYFSKRALCSFHQKLPERLLWILSKPSSQPYPGPCLLLPYLQAAIRNSNWQRKGGTAKAEFYVLALQKVKKMIKREISGFGSWNSSDLKQVFWAWLLRELQKLLIELLCFSSVPWFSFTSLSWPMRNQSNMAALFVCSPS